MMVNRPPGPWYTLKMWLLTAISDGCEAVRFRQVRGMYEMQWVVNGETHEGIPPEPWIVRRFPNILWRFAHGRPGLAQRVGRFGRRLGTATEGGVFDLPVGPDFVVAVSYRAAWQRGGVSELEIALGDGTALSASGIAKLACDLALYDDYLE